MTALYFYCLARQGFTEYYFRRISLQVFQINNVWVLKGEILQYPEQSDIGKDIHIPQVLWRAQSYMFSAH